MHRIAILALFAVVCAQGQNRAPAVSGLSPQVGSGLTRPVSVTVSDPDGAANLGVINVLVNDFLNGAGACYLAFVSPANALYLVNDVGDGLIGPVVAGVAGSAVNKQCAIDGSTVAVARSGNELTLTVNVTFSAAFAGDKVIYVAARDAVEAGSGWQVMGTHRVPRTALTYPTVNGMTPAGGTGSAQAFTVVYQDQAAATNLKAMQLLINSALDGRGACYVGYDREANQIYLLDDAGTTLLTGVTPGRAGETGSGLSENSQCRVRGGISHVSDSGGTVSLTVGIAFKDGFVGRRIAYAGVQTMGGANSGWQALGAWGVTAAPYVDVLLSQYDTERTAANRQERTLHPGNVNPAKFGRLYSRKVDASVYALPLVAGGVELPGGARRNLLIVATMGNSVYAFDADNPNQTNPIWMRQLATPGAGSEFIGPLTWGVLSTPVIDRASNTVYAVAKTELAGKIRHELFALDLSTGAHKFNSPQVVTFPSAAAPEQDSFAGAIQRPGLLVSNGVLYAGFANIVLDPNEWRSQEGYLQAYSATDLSQRLGNFQVTPTGFKGGIWQAGRGVTVDAEGNLYIATAGGEYNGVDNFGASILKLAPRTLALLDWFTPANWETLYHDNLDPSANGVTLIPGTALAFAGGKEGVIYLLNRLNMGKLSAPVQSFLSSAGCGHTDCAQSLGTAFWSRPGLPDSLLYVWDRRDYLRSYRFVSATSRFETTALGVGTKKPETVGGPSVSAFGEDPRSGVVWAVTADVEPGPGVLRAYDAADVRREIYNSESNQARDQLGRFTKFAAPVVANGKVYVVTQAKEVVVYGLLP